MPDAIANCVIRSINRTIGDGIDSYGAECQWLNFFGVPEVGEAVEGEASIFGASNGYPLVWRRVSLGNAESAVIGSVGKPTCQDACALRA